MNLSGWLMTVAVLMSVSIGRALAGETATAVAMITAGFVTGITVTSGGSGYTGEPVVTFSGGGGSGATAKAILSGDKVAVVVVLTAGSGYTSIPTVTLAAPAVESWMTFRMAPAVRVEGKVGQGFAVERLLRVNSQWTPWTNVTIGSSGIELVDLENRPGLTRYRSRFSGVPATATAKLTAGFVTGITIDVGGECYFQPPRVTLIGGGGSGATAQAILNGDRVGTIIVLTAGTGYSSVPTVKIDAPSGEFELLPRMVPVLSLRVPLDGGSRIEVGRSILGPWAPMAKGWGSANGRELVDFDFNEQERFYRLQKIAVPPGFVWIAPGTFIMGNPDREWGLGHDELPHIVTLTQGFWLSDHEVTQAEYLAVMGNNPSGFKGDLSCPVETVSWNDAVGYCQKLTDLERVAGRITGQHAYRLPTEAEWEFAARAGTTGARHGELDAIAWWSGNSEGKTYPVKTKAANSWGLYDMLGNVFEWCSDFHFDYGTETVVNPVGPGQGSIRMYRGGNWYSNPVYVTLGRRAGSGPTRRYNGLGFRPALSSVR